MIRPGPCVPLVPTVPFKALPGGWAAACQAAAESRWPGAPPGPGQLGDDRQCQVLAIIPTCDNLALDLGARILRFAEWHGAAARHRHGGTGTVTCAAVRGARARAQALPAPQSRLRAPWLLAVGLVIMIPAPCHGATVRHWRRHSG